MAEFTKYRIIEELKASTQNANGMFEISEDTICNLMSMLTYAAPKLPQPAVPDMATVETTYPDVQTNWQDAKMYAEGWNACRAAMLQAEPVSNSDELPLDYLQGHKDGLEWAAQLAEANHPQTGDWLYDDPIDLARAISKGPDMPTAQAGNHTEQHLDMVDHSGDDNEKADCKLPFDQWLSQQNEPIDVDCGCVTTEAFYHWLRVAYEAGNSPVTPDGYADMLQRWLVFGIGMLKAGSQLPRNLIAETKAMVAALQQEDE